MSFTYQEDSELPECGDSQPNPFKRLVPALTKTRSPVFLLKQAGHLAIYMLLLYHLNFENIQLCSHCEEEVVFLFSEEAKPLH